MTGDGVNDAPALKRPEVDIAVSSATDVAKDAARLVLTGEGLADVVAAVETGRRIYQRMLTYTLNKFAKTFQVSLFLGLGLHTMGSFVTTPRLVLLLVFANDFVTMPLATDRVGLSAALDRWQVPSLSLAALGVALPWLGLSFATYLVGRDVLGLGLAPPRPSSSSCSSRPAKPRSTSCENAATYGRRARAPGCSPPPPPTS